MSFEDNLRRALDTLTDRVRDEVARQLSTVAGELSAAAATERESVAASVAAATRSAMNGEVEARIAEATAAATVAAEAAATAAAAASIRAAEDAAAAQAQALAAREQDADARVREAEASARAVEDRLRDAEQQQRDAAAQLQDAAARLREADIHVQEAEARGHRTAREQAEREWAARDAAAREAAAREAAAREAVAHDTSSGVDHGAGDRLVDAVRALDRARSLIEVLDTLASCSGREAARAGVLIVGSAAASPQEQLRGWRFIGFGAPLDEHPSVELTMADAGLIADTIRTSTAMASGVAPVFANLPPDRERLACPVVVGGQVVAVLYADEGHGGDGQGSFRGAAAWRSALEVMARHAGRCLEGITAVRAAQVLTDGHHPDRRVSGATGATDESARRYARLLVSEIKLYHEPEIIAGRRERNLATRLGGEIARARVLYEQRVSADSGSSADHFHAELVRMLADGDATLLEASS